ncbi:MAG TPA: hypothetical protein VND93_07565 [Myxococcales bacterium]|nr:hypothetical protein [Myxococcales bacterium]
MVRPRLLALLSAAALGGCQCQPEISSPLVLAYEAGAARIEGRGFGASGTVTASGIAIDSGAVSWSDSRIDLTLPAGVRSGEVTVRTSSGSATAPLEVYRLEEWDLPPSSGTNPSPLAIARDGRGRLWINEEFHNQMKAFDPASGGAPAAIALPRPPDPGPFAVFFDELFGVQNVDVQTQTSELGESAIVDPAGFVWFSEGGGFFYELTSDGKKVHPNHSRILRYDPASGSFRVYNVPGDRNEAVGLAWDAARGRIWFAEGGRQGGGAITGFDPERTPWDNAFDFSTSLDAFVNPPDPRDGFRRFPVPDPSEYPSCLAVDAQGGVWYTAFLGNRVGRLDPDSGAFVAIPLPKRKSSSTPAAIFDTGGPWQIAVAADGAIWIDESFDLTVDRIDADRVRRGDPACQALDASGRNPCVQEVAVGDVTAQSAGGTDLVHTIIFDGTGRLWFGHHGPNEAPIIDTLGIVAPDLSGVSRFPPLRAPGDPTPVGVTGLAAEPDRPVIWFEEYWAKRLARLTRLDP